MTKIIKWFAPVLTLGVAVFILFFILFINENETLASVKPLVLKTDIAKTKSEKIWLENFSESERLGYFYPVNEVLVILELNEQIIQQTIYKLSASILDPYQLFCLKEELGQHGLKYYLQKDSKDIQLLIFSKNIQKLNSLVKILKNYQINAVIEPYKEDV